jgi:hypothetical protein
MAGEKKIEEERIRKEKEELIGGQLNLLLDDIDKLYSKGYISWQEYQLIYQLKRLLLALHYMEEHAAVSEISRILAEVLREIYRLKT